MLNLKRNKSLQSEIAGRKVICYLTAAYLPYDETSDLHKAIIAAGYSVADIGVKIDIAVAEKREWRPDGYDMAIIEL